MWQRSARPPGAADPTGRGALSVRADQIRPGDWLRDEGELKQVAGIDPVHERLPARAETGGVSEPTAFIVRFAAPADEPPSHLFIPTEVSVLVWRPQEDGP